VVPVLSTSFFLCFFVFFAFLLLVLDLLCCCLEVDPTSFVDLLWNSLVVECTCLKVFTLSTRSRIASDRSGQRQCSGIEHFL
jgi:hypothetical protein